MEYSSAMAEVICAPTGGAAGVITGAILGAAEAFGCSIDEKVKGYAGIAVVGICMAKDYNYSAELYGCFVVEPRLYPQWPQRVHAILWAVQSNNPLDAASLCNTKYIGNNL